MANLSVRKLDDEVVSQLRRQAAQHGVSMEEEVRRIIVQAVSSPLRLGDMALDTFGSECGVDLTLDEHIPHNPLVL